MAFGIIKRALATGHVADLFRQHGSCARVHCECQINLHSSSLRDWFACFSKPVRLFLGILVNTQKQALALNLLVILFAVMLPIGSALAVAPGTVISNTANADYSISGVPGFASSSNTDNITTTLNYVPANVSFHQYSPSGAGTDTQTSPSQCAMGSAAGPFVLQGNPNYPSIGAINVATPVNISPATRFHQGEPFFVRVDDANANITPTVRDVVQVTISVIETGDIEVLELSETTINSGVFVGFVPSTSAAMVQYDCQLSVQEDNNLNVTYTDPFDITDTVNAQALVDPFGIIIDSTTGNPVDGATVTIIDSGTGLPATVFGDDGVSTYPATITSGGSATDSGGTVYNFPPGGYRFPLMVPGTYRITIIPPAGYSAPSAVSIATLQTLPDAPFALDINASYGNDFILNAGPPLNVDIPADPSGDSNLFLIKQAGKASAGIGEFVRYTLTLDNTNLIAFSNNTVITDVLPRGFRYKANSAHLNGIAITEPTIGTNGRSLTFNVGTLAASSRAVVTYIATVIASAEAGKAVNTAQATNSTTNLSNLATATVIIEEDLFTNRSHVFGRVMLGNCKIDAPATGFVDMRLQSNLVNGQVDYILSLTGTTVAVSNMNVKTLLPPELRYIKGSAHLNNGKKLRPIQTGNQLEFYIGDRGSDWNHTILFSAQTQTDNPGTATTIASATFNSPSEKGLLLKASNSLTHKLFKPEDRLMLTLPNFNKSRISLNLSDRIELDNLVKQLRGQIIKKLKITGHSDSMIIRKVNKETNTYMDNYELSMIRAKSVGDYLQKKLKFNKNKISLNGFGPDKPIADNNTEAGRRANRRVEIEILTLRHKPRLKWLMLRDDSGLQRARIEDAVKKKGELLFGENLPGVEGIRLVTEEGLYVTTDDQGMYHLEGLQPGTHILQIDTATLPSHLEPILCEENTRFAGSGHSQFIDLQGGSLWRADFYLRQKAALEDNVNLRMRTVLNELDADITINLEGNRFTYEKLRLLVMLPKELKYIHGSSKLNNLGISEPEIQDGVITYRLDGTGKTSWDRSLSFKVRAIGVRHGEIITKAVLMFETRDGKRHQTPVAVNSLVHAVPEDRKQQFTFRPRFSSARAKLKRTDKQLLNKIISQFRNITVNKITVVGHADNQKLHGTAKRRFKDNKALSGARASSVAEYIRKRLNLKKEQVEVIAMGDSKPIASNDSAEGRAINRRVELFIDAVQKGKEGVWKPIKPKNLINYYKSKYEIDENNRDQFKLILDSLKKQNLTRIRVVGHSDSKGLLKTNTRHSSNYGLSRSRAEAVAKILRTELKLQPNQVVVEMMGASQPIAPNSTEEGRDQNRRVELFVEAEEEDLTLGEKPDWKPAQSDSGVQSVKVKVERTAREFTLPDLPKQKSNDLDQFNAQWLQATDQEFSWVLPFENSNPAIPSIKVGVKYNPAYKLKVELNGRPVNALNFVNLLKRKDGKLAASFWSGVNIGKGDSTLVATLEDANGVAIKKISRTVHYSGAAAKVEFVQEYSRLAANGRDPVVIAIQVLDKDGYPVRSGTVGEFNLQAPYQLKEELDALRLDPLSGKQRNGNTYKVLSDGIALIQIEPTTDASRVHLQFRFNDRHEEKLGVWLQAEQRDWVLAGLAEGTAAYKTIDGNMESLAAKDEEEGLNTDGRLAFYAKGSIKGSWLLTAAYDSRKEERPADGVLHGLIDPNKYYTLYGDATERRHDAPSRKKLYVKLERRQFYALFGDYNTGMTVTELSRYSRSLTGLKTEFESEHFDLNFFAAETEQAFVKDEIPGDGTSGLYKLSQQNIILNSEKITIETRDRFQSHVIITSRVLSRFIDYTIDPVNGTIYFREPIFSQDGNFNPIYIVVDYEVESTGEKSVTAGGRGAVKFLDKRLEVGVSAIHEGTEGRSGDLLGTDIRIQLTPNTELKAELANTTQESGTTSREGSAILAEITHRNKTIETKIYHREQEAGFGLGQQKGSETGTRKTGLDVKYHYDEQISIHGEARREDNLTTEARRDIAAAELIYREKLYTLSGGLRQAKDTNILGEEFKSNLLTLGASRAFMGHKLNLRANTELALGDDNNANPDYPSRFILGADYRLTESARIYIEEEFTMGEKEDTSATRIGIETKPWERARIRTDVTNEVSEYGPRTFAGLGLNQGFKLSDQWMLDFGFDQRKTVRDPGNSQFNVNTPPASGTVNNDYSAVSVGTTYKQKLWSATSRLEYRDAEQDKKTNILFGFYREHSPGIGMAVKLNVFKTENVLVDDESINSNAEFSLAYRPVKSHWAILDKLRFVYSERSDLTGTSKTEKFVNNLNVNWLINRQNQLSLHWGLKKVIESYEEGDFDGITQAIGAEYRYDIASAWDLGVRVGALYTDDYSQHTNSWGVSTGYNVAKNMWLTVGYNFDGFDDKDFSEAGYSAKGTYIKFRFNFDHLTARSVMAFWEDAPAGKKKD